MPPGSTTSVKSRSTRRPSAASSLRSAGGSVGLGDDAIAELLQRAHAEAPHLRVVLHEKNALASARGRLRCPMAFACGLSMPCRFPPGARQQDADRGAVADVAVDAHMTARLLHEAVHHRQAEPRPLPVSLVVKNGSNTFDKCSAAMP